MLDPPIHFVHFPLKGCKGTQREPLFHAAIRRQLQCTKEGRKAQRPTDCSPASIASPMQPPQPNSATTTNSLFAALSPALALGSMAPEDPPGCPTGSPAHPAGCMWWQGLHVVLAPWWTLAWQRPVHQHDQAAAACKARTGCGSAGALRRTERTLERGMESACLV
eukprot:1161829-Pelagomonas_calceolata.AAC.6